MKKLMTLVAVIFIAATSQAASVTWEWSTYLEDDGGAGQVGTISFYLVDQSPPGTPGPAPIAGATAFDSFTSATGGYANNTFSADSTALNGRDGWMRFEVNGYYVQTTFYITGLVGGGNPSDSSAIGTWVSNSQLALVTAYGNGTNFDLTDQAGAGWAAVPEPTSMALLALGVAAVGLRRRFRK